MHTPLYSMHGSVWVCIWAFIVAGMEYFLTFLSEPIVYTNPIPYGQGYDGITATGFQCTGDEASLSSCTYTSTGVDCGHQFDVGVDCNAGCTNGDTMITSGDIATGGYVLLCVNGNWEYISATGWGNEEAQVLCGEQGYSTLGKCTCIW